MILIHGKSLFTEWCSVNCGKLIDFLNFWPVLWLCLDGVWQVRYTVSLRTTGGGQTDRIEAFEHEGCLFESTWHLSAGGDVHFLNKDKKQTSYDEIKRVPGWSISVNIERWTRTRKLGDQQIVIAVVSNIHSKPEESQSQTKQTWKNCTSKSGSLEREIFTRCVNMRSLS